MLKISFIRIIYLKQQRNILSFRRSKFESFFMIVHTAGKDQIKYFAKN